MEGDLSRWKYIPCSWIGELTNIMIIISKLIYRFNATLIKIPTAFFAEMDQPNPRIHRELEETLKSQNNPEKGQTWRTQFTLLSFKTYYKASASNSVAPI